MIEYVWRHGGTFQEWSEHFSIDLWLEALAANGLDVEWYVYRHRTEDEVLPWDHLSAGLHKDFLWQDWRDALEELGLEDCRWTPCYDCARAPATGSNTWWHQPRRLRAEAREQASTCPLVERFPSRCRPASRSESVAREVANRAQQARQDPVHVASRCGSIWERALRRTNLPVAYSEGFTLVRSSRSASRSPPAMSPRGVPRCRSRSRKGADLDLAGLTTHLSAQLPVGMTATGVVVVDRRMPSLQQAVTSCTWQIDVRDVDESTAQAAIDAALAADELMITRERKGKEVTDDIRPLVFGLAVDQPTKTECG